MNKKDIVYFARLSTFDVCELFIRTVAEDYFVGIDKHDKRAYIFKYDDVDRIVFYDRLSALNVVKSAERHD